MGPHRPPLRDVRFRKRQVAAQLEKLAQHRRRYDVGLPVAGVQLDGDVVRRQQRQARLANANDPQPALLQLQRLDAVLLLLSGVPVDPVVFDCHAQAGQEDVDLAEAAGPAAALRGHALHRLLVTAIGDVGDAIAQLPHHPVLRTRQADLVADRAAAAAHAVFDRRVPGVLAGRARPPHLAAGVRRHVPGGDVAVALAEPGRCHRGAHRGEAVFRGHHVAVVAGEALAARPVRHAGQPLGVRRIAAAPPDLAIRHRGDAFWPQLAVSVAPFGDQGGVHRSQRPLRRQPMPGVERALPGPLGPPEHARLPQVRWVVRALPPRHDRRMHGHLLRLQFAVRRRMPLIRQIFPQHSEAHPARGFLTAHRAGANSALVPALASAPVRAVAPLVPGFALPADGLVAAVRHRARGDAGLVPLRHELGEARRDRILSRQVLLLALRALSAPLAARHDGLLPAVAALAPPPCQARRAIGHGVRRLATVGRNVELRGNDGGLGFEALGVALRPEDLLHGYSLIA